MGVGLGVGSPKQPDVHFKGSFSCSLQGFWVGGLGLRVQGLYSRFCRAVRQSYYIFPCGFDKERLYARFAGVARICSSGMISTAGHCRNEAS